MKHKNKCYAIKRHIKGKITADPKHNIIALVKFIMKNRFMISNELLNKEQEPDNQALYYIYLKNTRNAQETHVVNTTFHLHKNTDGMIKISLICIH